MTCSACTWQWNSGRLFTVPALNNFRSIHKFCILVSGLCLCQDHCGCWSVKLEEGGKYLNVATWCVYIYIYITISTSSTVTCCLPARPIICSRSASLYSSQEPDTYCVVDLITTRWAGRFTPMARVLVVTRTPKTKTKTLYACAKLKLHWIWRTC